MGACVAREVEGVWGGVWQEGWWGLKVGGYVMNGRRGGAGGQDRGSWAASLDVLLFGTESTGCISFKQAQQPWLTTHSFSTLLPIHVFSFPSIWLQPSSPSIWLQPSFPSI